MKKFIIFTIINITITIGLLYLSGAFDSFKKTQQLNINNNVDNLIGNVAQDSITKLASASEDPVLLVEENIEVEAQPDRYVPIKGENLYMDDVPNLSSEFYFETKFGQVPSLIFCKPKISDWGMVVLYLDVVDNEKIRYRRVSTRSSVASPAILYDSTGKFIKNEDDFPPSDCMERNIIRN